MKLLLERFTVEQLRLLLGCSCVIAVAGMFVYGILPELRTLQSMEAQRERAQQALAQSAITETDVSSIAAEVEQLRQALDGDLKVPPRQAEAALLRYLHRQASDAGIRLVRVAPKRHNRPDGVLVLQFEVEALGSYGSSAAWLEALDAADSQAVLSNFSLSPEDANGSKLRLRASVQAFRYLGDSV